MNKNAAISALSGLMLGTAASANEHSITRDEVLAAQNAWAEGIVHIGQVWGEGGDYQAAAAKHIDALYAYGHAAVLFKPTKAADDQFRGSFEEALSYFVGGSLTEDDGFAINPWTKVRFDNDGIVIDGDSALAMGNYYFTQPDGTKVKVEYSFGYIEDEEGNLRINLHHSSLPYQP